MIDIEDGDEDDNEVNGSDTTDDDDEDDGAEEDGVICLAGRLSETWRILGLWW